MIPKWCVGTLKFEHPTPTEVVLRVWSVNLEIPKILPGVSQKSKQFPY